MHLEPHPDCDWPENHECVVWRYMDFTKFVYMLECKSLFFTSIKNLDDKYEGMPTRIASGLIGLIPDENMRNMHIEALGLMPQLTKIIYVNCWTKSNNEIATMWKSYANTSYSLAIKSTFGRIQKSFTENKRGRLFGSLIKYKDYDGDYFEFGSLFNCVTHKRKEFESESEFRVMYEYPWDVLYPDTTQSRSDQPKELDLKRLNNMPRGLDLKVNLDLLITEVVLGPNTKPWFEDLVRLLLKKHSLNKKISNSRIDADPRHDV